MSDNNKSTSNTSPKTSQPSTQASSNPKSTTVFNKDGETRAMKTGGTLPPDKD